MDVIQINQSPMAFSPSCKEFERLVKTNQITHHNNPCLNWQINHAQITIAGDDLIKPVKPYKASSSRIDTLIACIMSLNLWMKMKDGEQNKTDNSGWFDNYLNPDIDTQTKTKTNNNSNWFDGFVNMKL